MSIDSQVTRKDVRSGYDTWAQLYDKELNPLVLLEEPLVRGWWSDPSGWQIADVGCGTGRHSVWLAERGAVITAFDASPGMMSLAAEKLRRFGIAPREHRLPDRLPLEDRSCDGVLFALVADHIEDLERTFRELRRVVRPAGQVIFTVLHPAMNLKGITARFTDPATGREVRVAAFEHTIADYVMAILRAGLQIDEMIERKADAALVIQTPRAEKYLGWPMLLAMRLSLPARETRAIADRGRIATDAIAADLVRNGHLTPPLVGSGVPPKPPAVAKVADLVEELASDREDR